MLDFPTARVTVQPIPCLPSEPDQHNGSATSKQKARGPAPIRGGQRASETHRKHAAAGDERAQCDSETQNPRSPLILVIQEQYRLLRRWRKARISLLLQGQAVCRAFAGGDKVKAAAMFARVRKGDISEPTLMLALVPFLHSLEHFEEAEKKPVKLVVKLVADLPQAAFVQSVKGFGMFNLACLIGECGDIASYRNPSCLWKRMGLAVIDGGRQRKVTDVEQAARHGYNPSRRALAYVLGEALIKKPNQYRAVYLQRKEYELPRVQTKMHAHRRAMRYMVKRVLRDLWIDAIK